MTKLVILDIFAVSISFLGMKIKFYFGNFLFVENIHGVEQLGNIWQLFSICKISFKGSRMLKNDWKLSYQLFFEFSSKLLELEIGCSYIRFYTEDSKPDRTFAEKCPEFSIFPALVSRLMKLGIITQKLSVVIF